MYIFHAGNLRHRGTHPGLGEAHGGGQRGFSARDEKRGHSYSVDVTNTCFKMVIILPAPPDSFSLPVSLKAFSTNFTHWCATP